MLGIMGYFRAAFSPQIQKQAADHMVGSCHFHLFCRVFTELGFGELAKFGHLSGKVSPEGMRSSMWSHWSPAKLSSEYSVSSASQLLLLQHEATLERKASTSQRDFPVRN